MAKQALGKGLGALIKVNSEKPVPTDLSPEDFKRVRDVTISEVVPSPLQPRHTFIDTPLDELMESIRQHGIIQPLIVRKVNGKYELIAGERRWRASQRLGLLTVPVIEREASDRDVLEMALIENLQRENLNPMEEAAGYIRLAKEFSMKQEEIAQVVGKSRASVANAMRLLDLHDEIQILVAKSQLSVGHAKAILAIKNKADQKLLSDQIIRRQLTVRATEKLAKTIASDVQENAETNKVVRVTKEVDPHIQAINNKLRERFTTHVQVIHSQKKGTIELEYYGTDDLNRILGILGISLD